MGLFESANNAQDRNMPNRKRTAFREKPRAVREAIEGADSAAQRALGRKGGESTHKKRTDKAEAEAYFAERAVAKQDAVDQHAAEENREHIVPLDDSE